MIGLKDMNGKYVCIAEDVLMEAFTQGIFTIYGLKVSEILELKRHKDTYNLKVETNNE